MNDDYDDEEFIDSVQFPSDINASTVAPIQYTIQRTPVIKVNDFKQHFLESLRNETPDTDAELQNVNLDLDDVRIVTEYEIFDNQIKSKVMEQLPNTQKTTTTTTTTTSTPSDDNNNITSTINTDGSIGISLPIGTLINELVQGKQSPIFDDTILVVAIYHSQRNQKMMELLVRGSQKLTSLRDKIYCLCDHIMDGNNRKSGFFFINNVFYNDKRQNENLLYSRKIIEWLNNGNRETSHLSEMLMENTTFNDLSLSLGEKYLYCHQGHCEHLMVFEELRMLNINDQQDINLYPIIKYQSKLRRRKCKVCDIYPAKYVTYGDPNVPESPYFFCDECYRAFHYSKEGFLLYSSFQVYPYYHE
ncbi:hypothetical protein DLAC_05608 [Tieghemostelium lacteum]|uniref:snRNA-activating protein complex subunit 3 n=1 Tax=Tieghemostelium lacteum TaxID=361077 RepID=A0A151ZGL4_TIELA|nr:hypothetical protein DLAC_05608 [Tieghemostelium lacteum]|eukprot:KYQ93004.1 hypothetical protein DLAC_05608 [Tieghemostelium lacteum]